jgi:hypothetical protein
LTLKERKEAKLLMTKILNAAKTIRRDAHEFHLHDETFAQMYCLTIFVEKAKVLMDTLKSVPPQDDTVVRDIFIDPDSDELVQGRVVLIPNGTEPREEVEEET